MRGGRAILIAAAAFLAGCGTFVETPETRIVHRGDTAQVASSDSRDVYLAADTDTSHHLQHAWNTRDSARVEQYVKEGKAFRVPSGTVVRVVAESFNERRVEVLEGALKGRSGWVPFALLKPASSVI